MKYGLIKRPFFVPRTFSQTSNIRQSTQHIQSRTKIYIMLNGLYKNDDVSKEERTRLFSVVTEPSNVDVDQLQR